MAVREGQEGSRWYNRRPTAEQVGMWFGTVPLHEGMSHYDYVGGVTLIQSTEKTKDVFGFDQAGNPDIRDRTDLVWVPYVKVETRVAYFWKLCELREWQGVIEPVEPVGGEALGLPPGFFRYSAKNPRGEVAAFVGCTMRVRILGVEASDLHRPPSASKIVPTATKWGVDENALMKAETGAIGRALGFAGMLVVPGSGVATAEDMQEALESPGAGAAPEPELPTAEAPTVLTDADLRGRAAVLVDKLNPEEREAFHAWARQRKLILAEAEGAALRGAVKKLEKTLDAVHA
jgi:hypothetical protein